jgi:hypothetical protein
MSGMRAKLATWIVVAALTGASVAAEHPEHPSNPPKPPPASKAEPHALDGTSFSGTLVKSGESAGEPDEIAFKKGKLTSSALTARGFKAAPYKMAANGGVETFTATASNASGETVSWTGTLKDGVLEATAIQKSASGEATYTFRGQAKQ